MLKADVLIAMRNVFDINGNIICKKGGCVCAITHDKIKSACLVFGKHLAFKSDFNIIGKINEKTL